MANAKNTVIQESASATRARHSGMDCKTISLKLDTRLVSQDQQDALIALYREGKWYRNAALGAGQPSRAFGDKHSSVPVRLPDGTFEQRKVSLGSSIKQGILEELEMNTRALAASKKRGRQVGALKFIPRKDSVLLKQYGITHKLKGSRVRLQGLGWFKVFGLKQLKATDEPTTAWLVRKPSGIYLNLTVYSPPKSVVEGPKLPPIGTDYGVKTGVTLSDGREYNAPANRGLYRRTIKLQRELARRNKGSRNWNKTRVKLGRVHERRTNQKVEFANQLVSILRKHERVYWQDDNISGWFRGKHWGAKLQDAGLGRVKDEMRRLENGFMVDRYVPTTQWCPECENKTKHGLNKRVFVCGVCGYTAPRDKHGASNTMRLGKQLESPQELGVVPVEGGTAAAGKYVGGKSTRGSRKPQAREGLLGESNGSLPRNVGDSLPT
jgi:putative transposase